MKEIDIYDFDKTIVPFDSGSFLGIFNSSLSLDNSFYSLSGASCNTYGIKGD